MQDEFGLHALAVEDAKHRHQRPRIEEYGETVFCVMHTVEFSDTGKLEHGEVSVLQGAGRKVRRQFLSCVRKR